MSTQRATPSECLDFIKESNRIEGIQRTTEAEFDEFMRFMALPVVTVADLQAFVKVYQPDAKLRDKPGLNVFIGHYQPPLGGPAIRKKLETILVGATFRPDIVIGRNDDAPYFTHLAYEQLHPFTDGNGRSGWMLWAWQMRRFPLGFLHQFYYQTLAAAERQLQK